MYEVSQSKDLSTSVTGGKHFAGWHLVGTTRSVLMITLECTEQKASGVGGMSRYMSQKVRERVPGSFASSRRSRAAQRPTPGG